MPGLSADLGKFNIVFGDTTVDLVAELVWNATFSTGAHEKIDDIQTKAAIARPGLAVHKGIRLDTADIAVGPNLSSQTVRLDKNAVVLTTGSEKLAGIARGVNERGALQLETTVGVQSIFGGEISLRPGV